VFVRHDPNNTHREKKMDKLKADGWDLDVSSEILDDLLTFHGYRDQPGWTLDDETFWEWAWINRSDSSTSTGWPDILRQWREHTP
jgi:hypothetical protein